MHTPYRKDSGSRDPSSDTRYVPTIDDLDGEFLAGFFVSSHEDRAVRTRTQSLVDGVKVIELQRFA